MKNFPKRTRQRTNSKSIVKIMSSKALTKFTESIEKDAPLVIVEDRANALGRSLTLSAVISNLLTSNGGGSNGVKILCSEATRRRAEEKFQGLNIIKIESIPDVIKELESNGELFVLCSITPLLIRSSIHQIVRLFRKLLTRV